MRYWNGFPEYESVAEKKAKATQKLQQLRKKNPAIAPVVLQGSALARTWWGKAWNRNLERYADYGNRIGRGKSYVRHGAVLDLKIEGGQATALVHEAWLRLVDGSDRPYASRRHFFSAAAQAMRHLLIERARRKMRERHGGALQRVDVDDVEIAAPADHERLIQINNALDELALLAPDKAEVVKLRFFVGLDEKEIAELLDLSPRTVERYWSYPKAWLFERIPK